MGLILGFKQGDTIDTTTNITAAATAAVTAASVAASFKIDIVRYQSLECPHSHR